MQNPLFTWCLDISVCWQSVNNHPTMIKIHPLIFLSTLNRVNLTMPAFLILMQCDVTLHRPGARGLIDSPALPSALSCSTLSSIFSAQAIPMLCV